MAILKLYTNGFTCGKAGINKKNNVLRGDTGGWNPQVSRRLARWLYSVDASKLEPHQYSFTLTVKECPPLADDWNKIRTAFIHRMRRMGVIQFHWLTEWQARGCPHLHGCLFFSEEKSPKTIIEHWLACASAYKPKFGSQNIKPIYDMTGWSKYLSKHSARGATHYQRMASNIPDGWVKTGRMWGKGGDWHETAPHELEMNEKAFCKLRRLNKNRRKAIHREELKKCISELMRKGSINTKRLQSAKKNFTHSRRLYKKNKRSISNIIGMNEFSEIDFTTRCLLWISSDDGAVIEEKGTGERDARATIAYLHRENYTG